MTDLVYIDPRTKEPCRRCRGKGFMAPWPGSNGLVSCGVCRAEELEPAVKIEQSYDTWRMSCEALGLLRGMSQTVFGLMDDFGRTAWNAAKNEPERAHSEGYRNE